MTSLEQTADFKITTSWEDNASGPLIRSTEKINMAWKNVRNEQRAVRQEFEINNRTLMATSRVAQSVNSVIRRGVSIFQTYSLMQIRSQDATKNLREEQEKLNEVFIEFGPNSKEYMDQLKDVNSAQEEFAKTTKDNFLGTILLVADAIGSMTVAAIAAIPKIEALNASLKSSGFLGGKGGKIVKGIGAIIGSSLLIEGGMTSGALNPDATFEQKLMSTGESALGGAILGATIGSVVPGIGTAIGAGVGAVGGTALGVASNFGPEIMKILTINNIINSPTPNQMAVDISNSTKRSVAFRAG